MKQFFKLLLVCAYVVAVTACCAKAVDSIQSDAPSQTVAPEQSSAEPLPQSALKLNTAKQNNSDTVAWLTIPGTKIDNPVLQSTDNNYYLRDEVR